MNHYRLQNGCARPPYGRWHKSSLDQDTVNFVYLREPDPDTGIIEIKDEAIYSYCESINHNDDDPQYVYCADDPFRTKKERVGVTATRKIEVSWRLRSHRESWLIRV